MQVVDPHMHLWDLERLRYPWLQQPRPDWLIGDYTALCRTHLPADFLAEAAPIQVLKVVHIDAGHDPTDPLAETRWLQGLADHDGSGGFPHGIVAAANLADPLVEKLLAAHCEAGNVPGIRQILNVHKNPAFDFVGRHFMREPAWRAGFKLLHKYDLSFDLQIYPSQMDQAAGIARDNPETSIIVNHAGMFVDRGSVRGWREWRDGLRLLAGCPNVSIKISGMGMLDHRWTVESLRPYALEAIDAFGTDRAMFASNSPVDRLFGSYEAHWRAFAAIVADMSDADISALFRGNAERIYRI